jgi:FAD:protein FMN transferase
MGEPTQPSAGAERPDPPGSERDGPVRIGVPGGPAVLHRFSHEAMATIFEVFTPHRDRSYAAQAAAAAFDLLDQLEHELSRFIPNSDISRINRLAAGEATRVGASAFECLTIARHVYGLTGGAFDIALGTGLPALDLCEEFEVRASSAGVQLDLGAIGKGYAVDRMAEVLEEWDIGPALVHGGFSSILALDPPNATTGWPLTFSDPLDPARVLVRLSVWQTALSASGLLKGDHIRDPRTGEPVRGRVAAWATLKRPPRTDAATGVAPRMAAAAVADALTTAFMLLPQEDIEALCAGNPGLDAWILPDRADGRAIEGPVVHFGAPTDR